MMILIYQYWLMIKKNDHWKRTNHLAICFRRD